MYLKAVGYLPPQQLPELQQTSVVHFLYQTRTLLLSHPPGPLYAARRSTGRFRRGLSTTKQCRSSSRNREPDTDIPRGGKDERSSFPSRSTASLREGLYREQRPQWSPDIQRRIRDSESPESVHNWSPKVKQSSQIQESKTPNSTITPSEKAVFDRIFTEISNNAIEKDKTRAREQDELEYLETDDSGAEDVLGHSRVQLDSIFNIAIIRQEQQKQEASAKPITREPDMVNQLRERTVDLSFNGHDQASFKQKRVINRLDSDHLLSITEDKPQAALNHACNKYRRSVNSLLNAAKTDVKIWTVLENRVFSLITQLNLHTKREEKEGKAALRRKKKAAKLALINEDEDESREKIEDTSSGVTKEPLQPLSTASKTEPDTTEPILTLVQSTYAHHCLHALRLFRERNISSPYALHFLPHIKSLGSVSYVLGATIDLYNEILFQKWTQYSDVQGIADLLEEMINQGISANLTTLEFLRFIDRSRRLDLRSDDENGHDRSAKGVWWQLRPIQEGWKRVKTLYVRFMDELGEEGRKDRDEMKLLVRRELVPGEQTTETRSFRKVMPTIRSRTTFSEFQKLRL